MIKRNLLLLFLLIGNINFTSTALNAQDTVAVTPYFSFHNNLWMNLHHFLFELASHQQEEHLKSDGLRFTNIGDSLSIVNLTDVETQILHSAVTFYKENIIEKPLLFSSDQLKWLQTFPKNAIISDTTYSSSFTKTLNAVRPVYEKHFWERHQKQNELLFEKYIHVIRATEDQIIHKMESLSGSSWDQVVRVDLTTYGNWAGAYSPSNDNIVVSSIDPVFHSSLYIEIVFHESSHLLFLRSSPFRTELSNLYRALSIKPSRSLWHAAMFYLCGLATRDALIAINTPHELVMEAKNVFPNYYNNESFKAILNQYYYGNSDLITTAGALVKLNLD